MAVDISDIDLSAVPDRDPQQSEVAGVFIARFPGAITTDQQLACNAAATTFFAALAAALGTTEADIYDASRITSVATNVALYPAGPVAGNDVGTDPTPPPPDEPPVDPSA